MEIFLFILTTLFVGMIAGFFFAYEGSINKAMKKVTAYEYVKIMQINNRILESNPFFLSAFTLPVILLPLITFLYASMGSTEFWLLALASAVYIVGTFGITMRVNVPLNRKLDAVALNDKAAAEAQKWYRDRWNHFNTIRTYTSFLSFILLIAALLFKG